MLLFDTNVVIWLAEDATRISSSALAAMTSARKENQGIAIAATTLWEIALLAAKGRLKFQPSVEVFLEKVELSYTILPLNRQIAQTAAHFSENYPRDPADRQIGATAVVHGLRLVTGDKRILASGEVSCIAT